MKQLIQYRRVPIDYINRYGEWDGFAIVYVKDCVKPWSYIMYELNLN